MLGNNVSYDAIVVFEPAAEGDEWIGTALSPGFIGERPMHVVPIVRADEGAGWVELHWLAGRLRVVAANDHPEMLEAIRGSGRDAWPFKRRATVPIVFPAMMSCVEVTKLALGVRWPGVLTPQQLRQRLARNS